MIYTYEKRSDTFFHFSTKYCLHIQKTKYFSGVPCMATDYRLELNKAFLILSLKKKTNWSLIYITDLILKLINNTQVNVLSCLH